MNNQSKKLWINKKLKWLKEIKLLPKLFIHSVSLILLVLVFVSGTIYYFQRQMLEWQANEKAESLAQILAYTSSNAIVQGDYGMLQQLIDAMIKSPDVESIDILDTIGRVIVADLPERRGIVYEDEFTREALLSSKIESQKIPTIKGKETWVATVPISDPFNRVGTARLKYSVEDTYAGLLKMILLIGVIAILMSLTLSFFFARSISNPIKKVVELATAYGQGNLEATIPIEREDEIGHLIKSLNKLSQDLKHMIEEKISNESLIMIGEFAAYIIHDLKNPLSGIHLLADGMHRRIEEKDPLKKYSMEILLATQKLEDFIGKTLDIARWTKIDKKSLQINNLIEEEVKTLKHKSIPVRTNYDPGMPEIQADSQLLSMAVRNLLSNAVEAIPDQGTISVETKRVDHDTIIKISDTGTGIDADRLGKIFRPFFSMKTQGHGLGLAMVKKAVILHQGKIEVKSEKGVGSQFTVILPDIA
jgi:signal transduction histidine kinase